MSRTSNNAFPGSYRPASSKTLLCDYIEERLRVERPGQHLEIETRLGGFPSARPVSAELFDASLQAPLVLAARATGPLRNFPRSLQQFAGKFEPALPADRFYLAAEACARLLPPPSASATLDFILRDAAGTRLSWDLTAGTVCESTKGDKENVDLLHQGRQYRLSTAFERCRPLSAAEFEDALAQSKCALIRLKLRETTSFQFMRFCCTRCLSSDKENVKGQLLAAFRGRAADALAVARQLMRDSGAAESFELENEIGDAEFLRNTLRDPRTRADFPAFVDRFLRNTELLDMLTKKQLDERGRALVREWAGEDAQPVAGSYLHALLDAAPPSA